MLYNSLTNSEPLLTTRQIFSALYSMLPSAKTYLIKARISGPVAAWMLLGFFVAGFVGIQIISRLLHHYIPSHVVDCDHSHEEGSEWNSHNATRGHPSRTHSHATPSHSRGSRGPHTLGVGKATESSPLLLDSTLQANTVFPTACPRASLSPFPLPDDRRLSSMARRPSMAQVQNRVMSFVKDTKSNCDESGPCYGYSEPCGQECFKHFIHSRSNSIARHSTLRTPTFFHRQPTGLATSRGVDTPDSTEEIDTTTGETSSFPSGPSSRDPADEACHSDSGSSDIEAQHHHHVPENVFMSIGLQTSIAIALHKLPEGFITYATNHAFPALGFSVFMALFIHNITEGFAMALPLYLALGSRPKAMLWSSLLGGISQPLGAGIAATWFKLASHSEKTPGFAVYGCMFAVTSGIMTSVSLQLFVESLTLNHNRNLCIGFAFLGMTILGMSNALTAE
jgi:ZIP family zinc transporter